MSNGTTHTDVWQRLIDEKARELHEQIAAAYVWVNEQSSSDEEMFNNITRQHYDWLRTLYEHELPLAKLMDEADLTVEMRGSGAKVLHPRLSIVSNMFGKVKANVNKVTKAVAGVVDPQNENKLIRIPSNMELGLGSLVYNDSIRFGFTLPDPRGELLGTEDPLYRALVRAVNAIQTVSVSLTEFEDEEEFERSITESFQDPKLRDSALMAVKDFAPSGRDKDINGVAIAGGDFKLADAKPLTKTSRKTVLHVLKTPVRGQEIITLQGHVRETDLDQKRFEVRGIEEGTFTDLRCIYGPGVPDKIASEWLNRTVKVKGRVDRNAQGQARLMKVMHLEVIGGSDEGVQQREFDFPDAES
jgi:hypothetical protein